VSKIFIDTNILVYSLDTSDAAKLAKARDVLRKVIDKHQPVLSTQVINEFFVIAAAEKANCEFVFSEDLNAGQNYRGVLLLNPLIADF